MSQVKSFSHLGSASIAFVAEAWARIFPYSELCVEHTVRSQVVRGHRLGYLIVRQCGGLAFLGIRTNLTFELMSYTFSPF